MILDKTLRMLQDHTAPHRPNLPNARARPHDLVVARDATVSIERSALPTDVRNSLHRLTEDAATSLLNEWRATGSAKESEREAFKATAYRYAIFAALDARIIQPSEALSHLPAGILAVIDQGNAILATADQG